MGTPPPFSQGRGGDVYDEHSRAEAHRLFLIQNWLGSRATAAAWRGDRRLPWGGKDPSSCLKEKDSGWAESAVAALGAGGPEKLKLPAGEDLALVLGDGLLARALGWEPRKKGLCGERAGLKALQVARLGSPNRRERLQLCSWQGDFLPKQILPLFQLEEAARNARDDLPGLAYPHTRGHHDTGGSSSVVVHQLWKSRCVPFKWTAYVASWGSQPSLGTYMLWTDQAMVPPCMEAKP